MSMFGFNLHLGTYIIYIIKYNIFINKNFDAAQTIVYSYHRVNLGVHFLSEDLKFIIYKIIQSSHKKIH